MIKSSALGKWTARLIGGLFVILYGSFLAREIYDGLFEGLWASLSIFAVLLLVSIAGYLLAWIRPIRGGVLLAVGGISMALFHVTHGDWVSAVVYGVPFIFCGALFILSAPRLVAESELDSSKTKSSPAGESTAKSGYDPYRLRG